MRLRSAQVKSVQAKSGQATYCSTFPTKPRSLRPEKQPKDFDLQQGSEFKRAETKLRKKHSAEKGWKQDVSNPPLRTSAKAVLSRSDLADETRARVSPKPPRHREQLGGAGHLSERRA
ncbi:hypothetical protein HMPREF0322_03278 [Desulfitobacterium hafniense DP7]|uniref:Uncharacterized protein n=1 Tax=Desulfitobacterium hafniense DP7 TaxID=537010 RepID=G9XQN0_DESHA|nr:hypothetical protein HMPREF0322_03278 [Desulfitobacterium hafniense DP7]